MAAQRSVLAQVGRSRPWIVGAVVWAVLLPVLGLGDDDAGDMSAVLGGGALFLYLLLVDLVRIAWPVRFLGSDRSRLSAGGKTSTLHRFKGTVTSADRGYSTQTSVDGSIRSDALGDVHGEITSRSRTSVHDRFTLVDEAGRQHTVQVDDASVPIGAGQHVTALWAVSPGRSTGRYLCFVNHSTGVVTWVPSTVFRLVYGASVGLGVLWAFAAGGLLMLGGRAAGGVVLALALVWYVVVSRLQAARLRRVGTRAVGEHAFVVRPPLSPSPSPLPPPPVPGAGEPGWQPDPTHRHELRYWDGVAWTAHVSDVGRLGSDAV